MGPRNQHIHHGVGGRSQAHYGSQWEEGEGFPHKSWKHQLLLGVLPTRTGRGELGGARPSLMTKK